MGFIHFHRVSSFTYLQRNDNTPNIISRYDLGPDHSKYLDQYQVVYAKLEDLYFVHVINQSNN